MKVHWLSLIESVQKLIDDDAAVINGLRNGPDVSKIRKNFERNIKEVSRRIEEFGTLVPDPEAETIELPFDSEEFAAAWNDYKEFLNEVYNTILVPVEERRRLTRLYRFASKKEETALEIIDFLISSRYKTIFKPNNLQLAGETPDTENADSGFTIKKNTL